MPVRIKTQRETFAYRVADYLSDDEKKKKNYFDLSPDSDVSALEKSDSGKLNLPSATMPHHERSTDPNPSVYYTGTGTSAGGNSFGGSGSGSGASNYSPSSGVEQWRGHVEEGLRRNGLPTTYADQVLRQIQTESSGNPKAINNWDSNAQAGTPSQGLLQCVSLETKILTRGGWKNHDEVVVGDETLGFNPETGKNEWTPITKVVHYENAPVWRIGHKNWHADVTPNHRWWSETESHVSQNKSVVCEECSREFLSARGKQVHANKIHGAISLPKSTIYRGEFVRTYDLKKRHRIRLSAPATTEGIPCLSAQDCAVIGWIQGDGHIRNAENNNGFDACIYQSKPEQVVKIRSLLGNIEHTESVRQRQSNTLPQHTFRLRRAYVTELWKRSGLLEMSAENFVLALSPEQRSSWLGAMIDAEGHRQKPKKDGHSEYVRISQVDGDIQEAIRLAIYLEGFSPRTSRAPIRPTNYSDSPQPCAMIGMAQPIVAPSTFGPHKLLPSQTVWCVKTDLETWTARLEDQIFLTGNTIPSTFQQYHHEGDSMDITDPQANIDSAIGYAKSRYGPTLMDSQGNGLGSGHGY